MLAPFLVQCILIVVDAFSKWVKVAITHTSVLSEATTEGLHLHQMFATQGGPRH